jgi:hypothetical protein
MFPVRVHLLLNHAPILASFLGLALLAYGLVRRSQEMQKAALVVLVVAACLTPVVFLSGTQAAPSISTLPDVSSTAIPRHQAAATADLIVMILVWQDAPSH